MSNDTNKPQVDLYLGQHRRQDPLHEEAIEFTRVQAESFPKHEADRCKGQLCPHHSPDEYAREIQTRFEAHADNVALELAKMITAAHMKPRYVKRAVANLNQAASLVLKEPIEDIFAEAKKIREDRNDDVERLNSNIADLGPEDWVKAHCDHLTSLIGDMMQFNVRVNDLERIYQVCLIEGHKEAAELLKEKVKEVCALARRTQAAEQQIVDAGENHIDFLKRKIKESEARLVAFEKNNAPQTMIESEKGILERRREELSKKQRENLH